MTSEEKTKVKNEQDLCHLLEDVRVTSPSTSSEDSRKIRNDSGCSYEFSEDVQTSKKKRKAGSGSGHSTDSGQGSSDIHDEGIIYAYHFKIPNHLCGVLIGAKGASVKQLRQATKCEIDIFSSGLEARKSNKKADTEPQICVLKGTRSGIERCLELIEKKFPADSYPDFSLRQINEPSPSEILECQASREGLCVSLPPGQVSNALLTAIVSPAHVFIQLPDNPTFVHLPRLEQCMLNVYDKNSHLVPKVPKDVIATGLVAVAKDQDKYYRVQIVDFDPTSDVAQVKFLDYGGYDQVEVEELWQIRQDFLNLPFQAVECYLSNVIPPLSCSEWPFESVVHLEELTRGKDISCREIGLSEDTSVPIVQLYVTTMKNGELETLFINKELVDIGAAQWIEHQHQ